ncbi:MAG: endonuclease/exonuclease/phosphatase family protein, partial [Trebonia sp.]
MILTFGTYNLEYGGIDHGSDARLRRQLALLDDAGADVWALQECNWGGSGALYLAEQALGMRGFLARSARHPRGGLAVLVCETSGITITGTRHEEGPPYWHGVAVVHAEVAGFGPLRFASAHLAPSSPAQRLIESEALALLAEKDDLGPLVIGGDWNAVPVGGPAPDTGGIHPGKARRKLDSRAAGALAEYMTDAGACLGATAPTVGHRSADRLAYLCDRVYT